MEFLKTYTYNKGQLFYISDFTLLYITTHYYTLQHKRGFS